MALVTPQYTETALIGYLTQPISASDTTIYVQFFDKITGAARTPQSSTKLFVIDKGSETFPNSRYEIILAGSHSTAAGVTTLSSCTRGLAKYGTSVTGGTGNQHVANAEIGPVDLHYLFNLIVACIDGTSSSPGFKLGVRPTFELAGLLGLRIFADTTARDAAITAPQNGDTCFLTSTGVPQWYGGGSWNDFGTGATFVNASTTVAGKIEIATAAEMGAGTGTGGTGALLVPPNSQLVKTSSGASDENKLIVLDAAGKSAEGFAPSNFSATAGEDLTAGQPVYIKASDSKAYKTTAATAGEAVEGFCGFVVANALTGATATISTGPGIRGLSGLTAGSIYYIADTAGTLATTPGTIQKTAGVATSATTLYMDTAPRVLVGQVQLTQPSIGATADTTVTVGFRARYVVCSAFMVINDAAAGNQTVRYYDRFFFDGTTLSTSNMYLQQAPIGTFGSQNESSTITVVPGAGANISSLTVTLNSITATTAVFRLANAIAGGTGSANGAVCRIKYVIYG